MPVAFRSFLAPLGPLLALIVVWGLFFLFGNHAIASAEGIESIVQQTVVIGIAAYVIRPL